MTDFKKEGWKKSTLQVFWGEIAPCDHIIQIYENDKVFLDSLEGFIGSGLIAGDGIIIIATPEHVEAIENRLKNQGFDMNILKSEGKYIALDAAEMLAKFMVNNWPDEKLFDELITALFKQAHQHNQKIRAFGEMVAMLWEKGLNGATVHLECLWNKVHEKEDFTLFCAYPKIGFTQNINTSIETICCEHSKIIDGSPRPSTEVFYKAV
ncbi:hypothetical protein CAP36_10555 [Chitinophagaceae bacterium IBVUCB2]|nr:hypothetical protein CAP36_10555 [Chitinophagaceae bacterium IBVUCB2]